MSSTTKKFPTFVGTDAIEYEIPSARPVALVKTKPCESKLRFSWAPDPGYDNVQVQFTNPLRIGDRNYSTGDVARISCEEYEAVRPTLRVRRYREAKVRTYDRTRDAEVFVSRSDALGEPSRFKILASDGVLFTPAELREEVIAVPLVTQYADIAPVTMASRGTIEESQIVHLQRGEPVIIPRGAALSLEARQIVVVVQPSDRVWLDSVEVTLPALAC